MGRPGQLRIHIPQFEFLRHPTIPATLDPCSSVSLPSYAIQLYSLNTDLPARHVTHGPFYYHPAKSRPFHTVKNETSRAARTWLINRSFHVD